MEPVRGVLLDIDGTLVDSNDAHALAWVKALTEAGIKVQFESVRHRIGMGGDKLLPEVCGLAVESAEGKTISKRRGEIFEAEFLKRSAAVPGAEELLGKLKALGLKLGVATSAKKDELAPLLKVCGADKFIHSATSSDDAEESKPDPDILHAALDRLKLPATAVVMLGDTPYDVEAARKAGVRVVALRCGGWKDADLKADETYDDPADLAANLESSVFAVR